MNYEVQTVDDLNALRRAFLKIPDGQAENEPKTNFEWDKRAIERYKGDERLQDLLKRFPLSETEPLSEREN